MAATILKPNPQGLRGEITKRYRAQNAGGDPSIVFVSGNFNVIHPGHQRLIQFAADCGDVLVVGINPDSTKGVMFAQHLRVEGIKELSSVDYVLPIQTDLVRVLEELRPNIVVKGKEHESKENIEEPILKKQGGLLVFGSGETKFSSIDMLRQDFENIQYSTIHLPREFLVRHKIANQDLMRAVNSLRGLRVLVIGDTIVDEYITCEALGLSQEDPTIVVNPIHRKKFIGGASIVAAHAAGLGAKVKFHSVVGKDENATFVAKHLEEYGVEHALLEDVGRPTTLKQRYRTKEKTLLRVNELRQHSISKEMIGQFISHVSKDLASCDLLVFSDFNYGCLPTRLVEELTDLGKKHGVIMVADSQSSSQMGDISRFKDMRLLTPTEREARLGVSDFESGLVVLGDRLIEKTHTENVFITLGAEGLLIRARAKNKFSYELVTDQLPAFNVAPKDTAGAGDSLLITASLLMAAKWNPWICAYLGSLAAAIQVSRVGNTPLTAEDLLVELRTHQVQLGAVS